MGRWNFSIKFRQIHLTKAAANRTLNMHRECESHVLYIIHTRRKSPIVAIWTYFARVTGNFYKEYITRGREENTMRRR